MKQNEAFSHLSALYCFACAAKHLSFRKAAEELCVTASAVSHRIRRLEEYLGFPLFHRFTRHIVLTGEGRNLYGTLQSSLREIEEGIHTIRTREMQGNLIISCPPSFAGIWLVPRLTDFAASYPGISVHLSCRNTLVDFETEKVDAAVYYGAGNHPNLYSVALMDESLRPVCSPAYADKHGLWETPENLAACFFLHDSAPWPNAQFYSEWATWAEHAGLENLNFSRGYSFDRSELAVAGAKNSLGVAIGRSRLVSNLLDSGELVAPFKEVCPSPQSYYLACTRERAENSRIACFFGWALRAAREPERDAQTP